jgi:hypothetical protein
VTATVTNGLAATNGTHLGMSVGSATNSDAVGGVSLAGLVQTGGLSAAQAALVDPVDRYGRSTELIRTVAFKDFSTSAGNSGTIATAGPFLQLQTAGSSPSNAYAYAYINSFNATIGSGGAGDPRKAHSVELLGVNQSSGNATPTATFGFGFGLRNGSGDITNAGWWVKIDTNNAVVSQLHDGASLTAVTNGTINVASVGLSRLLATWNRTGGTNFFTVWGANASATVGYPPLAVYAVITNTSFTANNFARISLDFAVQNVESNTTASTQNFYIKAIKTTEGQ